MHVYEKPEGIPAWLLGFIDLRELLIGARVVGICVCPRGTMPWGRFVWVASALTASSLTWRLRKTSASLSPGTGKYCLRASARASAERLSLFTAVMKLSCSP